MHALLQCWFEKSGGFFCLFVWVQEKKSILNNWESGEGDVFCSCFKLIEVPFSSFIFTSQWFQKVQASQISLKSGHSSFVFVFCFVFDRYIFLYYSREQLVFAGPLMVSKGRVITISDLKEVLKAKTEEKDRQKGGKGRSYHESHFSWECPVKQQSVNTKRKKSSQKKRKKKLYLRLKFMFLYFTQKHSWRNLFFSSFGCWVKERKREKERDCDASVTLWSHSSRKKLGKHT